MIKKLKFLVLCAFAATMAYAQGSTPDVEEKVEYSTDKYKVETNRFWDNWFLSVGGGAQIYFGDHDKQASFGKRLAPALDVAVGKWFTPGLGLRLEYSGLQAKGATQHTIADPAHSTGKDIPGKSGWGQYLQYQKFSEYNIHADLMFNLSNLFCGYNEKRIWNCTPYAGLGWARVWDSPQSKEVTANLGLVNSFRLCSALDLNVDVRTMLVKDRFDGEIGGRNEEGMLTATVGLTYKFKKRGWDRARTVTRYDNTALNDLRRQLNDLNAENDRLKNQLADQRNVAPEKETVVKRVAAGNLVIFQIGKTELSNEARANLGLMAQLIKDGDKDAVYTITGYADKGTGSARINERLSRERAQAVYDCLTKEFGVSESQLRMDYKGGVDNMFYNDPCLSRAVITRCE